MPRRAKLTLGLAVVVCSLLASCAGDALPLPSPSSSASATDTPLFAPSPTASVSLSSPPSSAVEVFELLSVDQRIGADAYGLAGAPDGLGIILDGTTPTLLIAHELRAGAGQVRTHGQAGAFVSAWTLGEERPTLERGQDFIQELRAWDSQAATWSNDASTDSLELRNLCAASLVPGAQLWDAQGNLGYQGSLFLINEEHHPDGRTFAVTSDGIAFQLPALGLSNRESVAVARIISARTVAIVTEDSIEGQLRVYAGYKRASGNPVERAGLSTGTLWVLADAEGVTATESDVRLRYGKGTPLRVALSEDPLNPADSGERQNAQALRDGITFSRIEDGAFDPMFPNDYYFTTTVGGATNADPDFPGLSRDGGGLWRLRWDDIRRPELGGTLVLLLDGSEWPFVDGPDNIEIDRSGHILIQEDPTSPGHERRIIAYRIADGATGVVTTISNATTTLGAQSPLDPSTPAFESSGVVDASELYGEGWFLFTVQIHTSDGLAQALGAGPAAAAVEHGKIMALHIGDWDSLFAPTQE